MKLPPVGPSDLKRSRSEEPDTPPSPKVQRIETALQVFEQTPHTFHNPNADLNITDPPESSQKTNEIKETVIPPLVKPNESKPAESLETVIKITKEGEFVEIKKSLIDKSQTLRDLIIDLDYPTGPQIEVGISPYCDLNELKKINDVSHDLNLLDIPDMETCFKIFQIADYLNAPELFAKVDDFLDTYLNTLDPKCTFPGDHLVRVSKFDQLESHQAERAKADYLTFVSKTLNNDFKDLILWHNNDNLPKAHRKSEQKIQMWIQSAPNSPDLIVTKCQFLAQRGVQLDTLNLSFAKFTDNHVNAIIDCQPHIKELNLSNTLITGNIKLENLSKLTSLKAFDNQYLNDQLGPHLHGTSLTSLNLSHCPFLTDALGQDLSKLALESLQMEHNNFSDAFVGFIANQPLKYVNFSFCARLTDNSGDHMSTMPIETLMMHSCSELTNNFGRGIANCPIKHLDMGHCDVDDGFGEHIVNMPLENLDMTNTLVTHAFGASIVGKALKILTMAQCENLTDEFMDHLVGMPLVALDISSCPKLSDDAFGLHFSTLTQLQDLNVSECTQLTNDFGLSLPPSVQSLDISGCEEIDDGFSQHLVELPIRKLKVTGCDKLTNAFIAALTNLPLTELDISGCPLFTNGLAASIALLVNLSILEVDENCEGLTPEFYQTIAALPRAVPITIINDD